MAKVSLRKARTAATKEPSELSSLPCKQNPTVEPRSTKEPTRQPAMGKTEPVAAGDTRSPMVPFIGKKKRRLKTGSPDTTPREKDKKATTEGMEHRQPERLRLSPNPLYVGTRPNAKERPPRISHTVTVPPKAYKPFLHIATTPTVK